MIIREVETNGGTILRAMLARQRESDKTRPAGLHVSTIINDYVDCVYPPRKRPEIAHRQRIALYELGDIIEEVIADELRKRSGWEKPKPTKVDGVWCSPDGYAKVSATIDEMKSTRLSCGQIIRRPDGRIDGLEESPKLLKYILQLKAYMYAWDAKRGRLHVAFLNGDWRPPFPIPRTFVVRPETDHELQDTWDMLMDHAKERDL